MRAMSFVFSHNGGKGAIAFLGFIDLCVGISGGGKGGGEEGGRPGCTLQGAAFEGRKFVILAFALQCVSVRFYF